MNLEVLKRISKDKFVLEVIKDISNLQVELINYSTKQNANAIIDSLANIIAQQENIKSYLGGFDNEKIKNISNRLEKAIIIKKKEIDTKIKRLSS